jgi:transposase
MKTLLANPALLHLEKIAPQDGKITIVLNTIGHSHCPKCGQPSTRIHSQYQRCVADLPWEGIAVKLELHTRKFFCSNDNCAQRIFCERLPEVVRPYGRKTIRFNDALTIIGFALGGRPGERACSQLTLQASARTLLRRVRNEVLDEVGSVRVLGVDDFAFRKGQRYGTILVDLEKQQVIELLPDREAATLESWLNAHPEIECISRDRSLAYAEASSKGAPQAIQVADRFHLMKNIAEAFERVVQKQSPDLREAARQVSPRYLTEQILIAEGLAEESISDAPSVRHPNVEQRVRQNREQRMARYEAVKKMHNEGYSISAIARHLGMHREIVRNFLRAESYPERAPAYRKPSKVAPFDEYLRERWSEGCFNSKQLYREIKRRGYRGSQVSVRRYVKPWRKNLPPALHRVQALPDFSPPSPRQAAWWLLKQEDLEPQQKEYVQELLQMNQEINEGLGLVKDFQSLLAGRKVEEFDQWRESVQKSRLAEIRSFADGLLKDEAAVRAAMTYDWSNGQVEGQVNRLKMIKRTMFGRAGFDLLRARVLHAP